MVYATEYMNHVEQNTRDALLGSRLSLREDSLIIAAGRKKPFNYVIFGRALLK